MPSDRTLIEADKSFLRRKYPATADGLAQLKALAEDFHDADPSNVEVTSTSFEGAQGGGQLTHRREIRRLALEELIAERDEDYTPPPARARGYVIQFGGGACGSGSLC